METKSKIEYDYLQFVGDKEIKSIVRDGKLEY